MSDLNNLLELALDTALGPAGAVLAIFLVLLLALLRGTQRLVYAIWFVVLYASVLVVVALVSWPGVSAVAAMNGWFAVTSMTILVTVSPLLIAAVPILLVAQVQVHIAIRICVGVLSSFSALVAFPLIALPAACYLGDCI